MPIRRLAAVALLLLAWPIAAQSADPAPPVSIVDQGANSWVLRSPLPGGPPSPHMGYESSMCYDPANHRLIRWGGHDPGGGGPQLSETWAYDLDAGTWTFLQPNNSPPGNCCCRENVRDPDANAFVRFSYPAFGHGWMWDRARYLREDSVWTFDLGADRWTDMRPGREPALNVGKPAMWDPNHGVIWVYDTKLRLYDPWTNTWHTVNPGKEIGKRTYAGMALDPRRNKIVLFGDHYQSDERTWVYDIAADAWTDMKPAVHPPGIRTCPTMVYDSANDVMICVMLADRWDTKDAAKKHLETWTYKLDTNTWTKMEMAGGPDDSGTRDRLMLYLPDRNIVVLEARTSKEQQIWTYRLAKPAPAVLPPTPTEIAVVTLGDGKAAITCKGMLYSGRDVRFQLYRAGPLEQPWQTQFRKVAEGPSGTLDFTDTDLEPGKVYDYYATYRSGSFESPPTRVVRTQPHVIVGGRVDVLAPDKVVYSWSKSADPDVTGYVVERAVMYSISAAQKVSTANEYTSEVPLAAMAEKRGLGPWQRLTPQPIAETNFSDGVDLRTKVALGEIIWQPWFGAAPESGQNKGYDMSKPPCPFTIYAYRVRAVNRLGVEGGPSPYQLTIANEVENLFSRETDKGAELKWAPSPHKDIRGYYVFRQDGRGFSWDKDSHITLLTPEPIRETTFTDATAGGKARRYHVVVADALGQQGIPSCPVWSNREWSKVYDLWTPRGQWHQ
ncbi:MAG: hypothetical protein BIFFINMI_00272 [Phycisphaerae bacterium]|nr:hypothetical protein [Phycisphaerae bacterium]